MLRAYRRILLTAVVLTLTGLHISRLNAQIAPEPGKLGEWVTALAIDPQDTRRLYAGSRYGTYLSTDGGVSWNVLSGSPDVPNALAVNPSKPHTIFATTYGVKDEGVFRSEDGGNRWSKVLPVVGLSTVAIDPLNPDTIYAGSCYCDIGSVPGLFQTTDGGTTWIEILGAAIHAVALDPRNPTTVYAATRGGIYQSTGAGFRLLRTDPTSADYVIAIAVDFQNPETVYAGMRGTGLFKSVDGGDSWTRVIAMDGTSVRDVAVDPNNSHVVYAAITKNPIGGGSLLKSIDGGETWVATPALDGVTIFAIAIDPKNSNILYLGTPSGVWKSTNAGLSWSANPILRLNSMWLPAAGRYCVGDTWTIRVSHSTPNTPIQLEGISNNVPWTVQPWAVTNVAGDYVESGVFGAGIIGRHSIRITSGAVSNSLDFAVTSCSPPSP